MTRMRLPTMRPRTAKPHHQPQPPRQRLPPQRLQRQRLHGFAHIVDAEDGRAAPVILDDALVYTDDVRIERMFDALHRQAADVQILVLTCRQRAFRDLGGTQLQIRPLAGRDSLLDA